MQLNELVSKNQEVEVLEPTEDDVFIEATLTDALSLIEDFMDMLDHLLQIKGLRLGKDTRQKMEELSDEAYDFLNLGADADGD